MADVTDAEKDRLKAISFDEECHSIRHAKSWPGDLEDAIGAQQAGVRDLLTRMIEAGFEASRARALIAEGSETALHVVRRWTRFVAKK
ncbi:N-methylhydantoinase B/oxoprolinase/acetone carboxylase alpha subunit [Bradyrhizobium sp. LB1.3]